MTDLLGVLLVVWGGSLVVLATALTLVIVVQGVTRNTRAVLARRRAAPRRALAGRPRSA